MSDYWEIVGFKKTQNGKTYGVKLGSAKKKDDGGFYLNFDALPHGEMSVSVCPPRDRNASKPAAAPAPYDLDDEIPF